jgi:putative ABC transport system permease protein
LFVYAALGVTVLLGGLGIMSVMLAAVQDRTREIGLRKALGAKEGLILVQFLLEAVLISLVAGFLGVVAGTIIFRFILAFALSIGLDPVYLKLITALMVLLVVGLPGLKKNYND